MSKNYRSLRDHLHNYSGLISFVGLVIVVSTFIVKDVLRDNQKDLVSSFETTRNVVALRAGIDNLQASVDSFIKRSVVPDAISSSLAPLDKVNSQIHCYSDLVWENVVTGQHVIWLLQNGVFQSYHYLPTAPTNWRIVGAADFMGDGNVDLAWENMFPSSTYSTFDPNHTIWFLKNGVYSRSQYLPSSWGYTSRLVGVGDFLGHHTKGVVDLLWLDTQSGIFIDTYNHGVRVGGGPPRSQGLPPNPLYKGWTLSETNPASAIVHAWPFYYPSAITGPVPAPYSIATVAEYPGGPVDVSIYYPTSRSDYANPSGYANAHTWRVS
jgi:hypothetical protein